MYFYVTTSFSKHKNYHKNVKMIYTRSKKVNNNLSKLLVGLVEIIVCVKGELLLGRTESSGLEAASAPAALRATLVVRAALVLGSATGWAATTARATVESNGSSLLMMLLLVVLLGLVVSSTSSCRQGPSTRLTVLS